MKGGRCERQRGALEPERARGNLLVDVRLGAMGVAAVAQCLLVGGSSQSPCMHADSDERSC